MYTHRKSTNTLGNGDTTQQPARDSEGELAAAAFAAAAAASAVPFLAPACVPKNTNEKQSVETGCAPRCIEGREAAAAQQQHSSSTAAAAAAAAVAAARQQQRPAPLRSLGLAVVLCLRCQACVCSFCVFVHLVVPSCPGILHHHLKPSSNTSTTCDTPSIKVTIREVPGSNLVTFHKNIEKRQR